MSQKTSDQIKSRLLDDAKTYARPEVRLRTIERVVMACDAIESGEAAKVVLNPTPVLRRGEITPTNVGKCVKAMGWPGPRQDTISNKREREKLHAYVSAREEERVKPIVKHIPNTQIENQIIKIEPVELRQFFRKEVEKRRQAEQLIKLLKSGLSKVPGINVQRILNPNDAPNDDALPASETQYVSEQNRAAILGLLERFKTENLRHIGLRLDGEDIVAMANGAEVVLSNELKTLRRLSESLGVQN